MKREVLIARIMNDIIHCLYSFDQHQLDNISNALHKNLTTPEPVVPTEPGKYRMSVDIDTWIGEEDGALYGKFMDGLVLNCDHAYIGRLDKIEGAIFTRREG
jgi:hypothetical protein